MADRALPRVSLWFVLAFLLLCLRMEAVHCDNSEVLSSSFKVAEFVLCHFYLTRCGDLLSLRRNFWFKQSLLILARDVAMNPGPFRFPCRVCARPMRLNQRGIECDVCH